MRKETKVNIRLPIILVFSIVILTITMLLGQGRYYRYDYQLQSYQRELKKIVQSNKRMTVEHTLKENLKKFQTIAEEKMQMSFPKKVELIYE